jgi:hypothetical protein
LQRVELVVAVAAAAAAAAAPCRSQIKRRQPGRFLFADVIHQEVTASAACCCDLRCAAARCLPPPSSCSAGVTTLHFESGGKSEGKEPAQASPKQPSPAYQSRALAEIRAAVPSSAPLADALRVIGAIAAAPLSVESIVERCDAAAIALIGCTRTRLFLLPEALDEAGAAGRMRAMQAGAPDTEHPVSGCAGCCIRTQQLLVYNDIAAAPDFLLAVEGCGARPPVSQAFAPVSVPGSLHSRSTTLGALQVNARTQSSAFRHTLLLLLTLCRS